MTPPSPIRSHSGRQHPVFSSPVLLWVLGALTVRALLSALLPLLPDESYYWEWSRRLSAGYFDHPPGIAILIRAGTALFGPTDWGVRVGPLVAGAVAMLGMAAIAARLAPAPDYATRRDSARRAVMLASTLPLAMLGLVLATPDAPFLALAVIVILCVIAALDEPSGSARATAWWCAAGVAQGAAMASKYTAVLVPLSVLLALALHPALRARLREPGPYLSTLIAALVFAPVIRWNAAHDWISFRFQLGHGFGQAPASQPTRVLVSKAISRELELLGGQNGLASPILFVLLALAVRAALVHRASRATAPASDATTNGTQSPMQSGRTDPRRFVLALAAVVPLLFFMLSATRRRVEANWPAMIYPPAIVLLATSTARWARERAIRWGIGLGALLIALVGLHAAFPIIPVAPRRDPVGRAFGWDALARGADEARRVAHAAAPASATVHVAAERYQDASELAFNLPDHPDVYSLNLGGRPNQFDLWPRFADRVHPGDALVAVIDANAKGDSLASIIGREFAATARGADVELRRGRGVVQTRRLWTFTGWHGAR